MICSLVYLTDHLNGYITSHLNAAWCHALPSHGRCDSRRPPQVLHQHITRRQRCSCPQCHGETEALLSTCTAVPPTSSAKPVSGYGHQKHHEALGREVRQPCWESPLGFGRSSKSITKLQFPHQNILNYSVLPTFRLQRKRKTVLSKYRCSSTGLLSWGDTEGASALTPNMP